MWCVCVLLCCYVWQNWWSGDIDKMIHIQRAYQYEHRKENGIGNHLSSNHHSFFLFFGNQKLPETNFIEHWNAKLGKNVTFLLLTLIDRFEFSNFFLSFWGSFFFCRGLDIYWVNQVRIYACECLWSLSKNKIPIENQEILRMEWECCGVDENEIVLNFIALHFDFCTFHPKMGIFLFFQCINRSDGVCDRLLVPLLPSSPINT